MTIIRNNTALRQILEHHLPTLAEDEGLSPDVIRAAIDAGTMIV